jgi:hypothetical protein
MSTLISLKYIRYIPDTSEIIRSNYLREVMGITSHEDRYPHNIKSLNEILEINKIYGSSLPVSKDSIEAVFVFGNGIRTFSEQNQASIIYIENNKPQLKFSNLSFFGSNKPLNNIIPICDIRVTKKPVASECQYRIHRAFKIGEVWKRRYYTKLASKAEVNQIRNEDGLPMLVYSVTCRINPRIDFMVTNDDYTNNQNIDSFSEIGVYIGQRVRPNHRNFCYTRKYEAEYHAYPLPEFDVVQTLPFMTGYFEPIPFSQIPKEGIDISFDIILNKSTQIIDDIPVVPLGDPDFVLQDTDSDISIYDELS